MGEKLSPTRDIMKKVTKRKTPAQERNAYLKGARKRIYDLMRDRRWHTRSEIISAATDNGEVPQFEALRRLRELRKFFHIESRPLNTSLGLFEYRLGSKN